MRTHGTGGAGGQFPQEAPASPIPCPIPGCTRPLAPGAPAQGIVLCADHWAGLTNGMRHDLLETWERHRRDAAHGWSDPHWWRTSYERKIAAAVEYFVRVRPAELAEGHRPTWPRCWAASLTGAMNGEARQCAMMATQKPGGVPLCALHFKMLRRGPTPADTGKRAVYAAAGLDTSHFPALYPPEGRRALVYSRKSVRTHGGDGDFYYPAELSTEP
jgi:hypothetical protein